MNKLNLQGVSADTVARGIFLLVSLINGVCGVLGYTKLDLDENTIYTVCSGLAVVISALWGFWKNNSFTKGAQLSNDYMKTLKNEDLDDIDLEDLEN